MFAARGRDLVSDKTLRRNPDISSIPVTGLAKALIVVTVSPHPGAAHHDPGSYAVRPGDTVSAIAARAYGNAVG